MRKTISITIIIAMAFVIQAFALVFVKASAANNFFAPVIEQDVSKMSNFEFISLGRMYLPLEPAGNKNNLADIAVDTYGDIYLSQSVPKAGDQWGQARLSKISPDGTITHLLTDPGAFYPEHLAIDDKKGRIYMGNGINGYLQIYNKHAPSVNTKATKLLQQYTSIGGSKHLVNNYGIDIGPNGDLFLIQRENVWSARYGHRFETVNFTNTLEFAISPTGYGDSQLGNVNDISVNRKGLAYIGDSWRPDSAGGGGDVEVFNGLAARNGAWDPIKRLDAGKTLNTVRKLAADGFGNVYAVDQHYWTYAYRINVISDNNELLKRIDLPHGNDDYLAVGSAILNPSGDLLVFNYPTPDQFQPFIETFALRQTMRPGETREIWFNGDRAGLEVYTSTQGTDPMLVNSITPKGGGDYAISFTAPQSTGPKNVRLVMRDPNGAQERTVRFNVRYGMGNPPPILPGDPCEILAYSFTEQTGPAVIDPDAGTIAVEVAHETDVTALVAEYSISDSGASVYVGDTPQESGTTQNDFTTPVTYVVTSEDGETTKNWTVTVTITAVDKDVLATLIEEADALDEADYTAESWSVLAAALSAAQEVYAEEEATGMQVYNAWADLNAAISALVPVGVVYFPDANLERIIRATLNKTTGDIHEVDMSDLTYLSADGEGIEDLSGLEYAINLQQLNLCDNQVSNIAKLANLTNLQILFFSNNQVKDITPLENLTNLQMLNFSNNQVSDITALANKTDLQALFFSNNQVSNITALTNLTKLQLLNFHNNQVGDITTLANLTKLQALHFYNNPVSDITALANLTDLQQIDFSSNQVSNITALANLNNLQLLVFSNNQVSDITALANLTNLQLLYIDDNYLNIDEGSQTMLQIQALIDIGVDVTYSPQKPIADLGWHTWAPKEDSNTLKTWTIMFSKTPDAGTINSQTVYVTDKNEDSFPVSYEFIENNVLVIPAQDYTRGETYTLWIKDLKAKDGNILSKNIKMTFTITE